MIDWLFQFLLQWYIWLPLTAILVFMTWQNYRKAKVIDTYDYVLLTLEIPRNNDKKELAAEQLFASLHGILRDRQELRMSGGIQEHLSFEIAAIDNQIRFYVRVPKHLQNFVEGQIYAQYPTVQIHELSDDYAATSGDHPDFIAIPHRCDGSNNLRPLIVMRTEERQECTYTIVESFEEEEPGK